jgi:hypothetical protein
MSIELPPEKALRPEFTLGAYLRFELLVSTSGQRTEVVSPSHFQPLLSPEARIFLQSV